MAQQDQCLQGRRGVTRSRDVQLQEEQQCVSCFVAAWGHEEGVFWCRACKNRLAALTQTIPRVPEVPDATLRRTSLTH